MTRRLSIALTVTLAFIVAGVILTIRVAPDTATAAGTPVPDQACAKCHQGVGLTGAPHEVLARTMAGFACSGCHGDASDHVNDPFEHHLMTDVPAGKNAALCLSCHSTGPAHVTAWADSSYAKSGQTCAGCHSIHAASDHRMDYAPDAKGFLGDGTCRMCHAPVFAGMHSSFHAQVIGQPGGGCEACHGAGAAHAAAALDIVRGNGPTMITKEPGPDACLVCHRAIPDRHAREMPVYTELRPECTVCHDVHVDRANPLHADSGSVGALADERVGSDACSTCHVTAVASAKSSVHAGLLANPEQGCEACHGNAKAHVMSGGRSRFIVNPLDQKPAEVSASCRSCHGDAPDHAKDWEAGPLAKQGLSCLTCHAAHGPAEGQGVPVGAAAAKGGEATRVGSESCAICHEKVHPDLAESIHAGLMQGENAAGCEACHGPGSAHVAGGGDKTLISNPGGLARGRQAEFCLSCHENVEGMFFYQRGEHARSGMTCTSCHDPLASRRQETRKTDPELCVTCHQDVRAEFLLPYHHPLDRKAVTCSSCHNPHSASRSFLSLETRKEACFECHKEKRGPFMYEHEADRNDGCVICHQPHGAVNNRLLTHRRVSDLCIQCHVTPASHNLAAGSQFQNCLNCHGSIHGSHVDKNFFR
jgi:DmsE family decaheme c-type cytochrome